MTEFCIWSDPVSDNFVISVQCQSYRTQTIRPVCQTHQAFWTDIFTSSRTPDIGVGRILKEKEYRNDLCVIKAWAQHFSVRIAYNESKKTTCLNSSFIECRHEMAHRLIAWNFHGNEIPRSNFLKNALRKRVMEPLLHSNLFGEDLRKFKALDQEIRVICLRETFTDPRTFPQNHKHPNKWFLHWPWRTIICRMFGRRHSTRKKLNSSSHLSLWKWTCNHLCWIILETFVITFRWELRIQKQNLLEIL